MQFWSGTAFMDAVGGRPRSPRCSTRPGYDGIVCSDHMIYPRELSSPYPDSPTGKPGWAPETAWPDSLGADRRDGRGDDVGCGSPTRSTSRPPVRCSRWPSWSPPPPCLRRAGVARGRRRMDARGVRADGAGLRQPRQAARRDDPRAARVVAGRLGVVERRVLPGARDDDRTAPARAGADPVRR